MHIHWRQEAMTERHVAPVLVTLTGEELTPRASRENPRLLHGGTKS